jgi:taurine dioxygenase
MVRTHPETGRRLIFVNEVFTQRVEGVGPQEGQELLERLFDHLNEPKFVYRHHWREGDLVIWVRTVITLSSSSSSSSSPSPPSP